MIEIEHFVAEPHEVDNPQSDIAKKRKSNLI